MTGDLPTQRASEWQRSAWNSGPLMNIGYWSQTAPPSWRLQWHPVQFPAQAMVAFQGRTLLLSVSCPAAKKASLLGSYTQAHPARATGSGGNSQVTSSQALAFLVAALGGPSHQWSLGRNMSAHQRGSHNLESKKGRDWGSESFPPPWRTVHIYYIEFLWIWFQSQEFLVTHVKSETACGNSNNFSVLLTDDFESS